MENLENTNNSTTPARANDKVNSTSGSTRKFDKDANGKI